MLNVPTYVDENKFNVCVLYIIQRALTQCVIFPNEIYLKSKPLEFSFVRSFFFATSSFRFVQLQILESQVFWENATGNRMSERTELKGKKFLMEQ